MTAKTAGFTPFSSDPCVIAVGGVDPGGGAGVIQDVLTARGLGARCVVVATAFTEQSDKGATGFEARDPAGVARAIQQGIESSGSRMAVKVGMTATPETANAIIQGLGAFAGAVVFDPVMGASHGGALFRGDPRSLLALARRSTLFTPNLAEAGALCNQTIATLDEARAAGRALFDLGIPAVLIKGGHLAGDATDVLVSDRGERLFSTERLTGASPRGTGCALATAIAVALAAGVPIEDAIAGAKAGLLERIRHAWKVGDDWHLR